MTEDIAAFIAARLDEDEAAAKACGLRFPGPWEQADNTDSPLPGAVTLYDSHDESVGVIRGSYAAAHIARHDPARVLREVEAIRTVIALTVEHMYNEEDTLRAFAAVWSGHPDYRAEWKP